MIFRLYGSHELRDTGYPKDWPKLSKVIIAEEKVCRHCGICVEPSFSAMWSTPAVHHKNQIRHDCRRENLLLLCYRCHRQEHRALWRFIANFPVLYQRTYRQGNLMEYERWRALDRRKPRKLNSAGKRLYRVWEYVFEREREGREESLQALETLILANLWQ